MDASRILSLGHAAGELQTPTVELAAIAKMLGIFPASKINHVVYYNESDVERIAEHIRSERAEDSA